MILYLSIWSGMRSGAMGDPQKAMTDVHRCMEYLKYFEDHWQIAGRGWQVLTELIRDNNLLPQYHTGTSLKRSRVEDNQGTHEIGPGPFSHPQSTHHHTSLTSDQLFPQMYSQHSSILSAHKPDPTMVDSKYQSSVQPTVPPTSMPVFSTDWMADPLSAFDQMFGELYGTGLSLDTAQSSLDSLHTMHHGSDFCDTTTYASACAQISAYPTQETFLSWTDGSTSWR
jgi:hypothetical protein